MMSREQMDEMIAWCMDRPGKMTNKVAYNLEKLRDIYFEKH